MTILKLWTYNENLYLVCEKVNMTYVCKGECFE